MTVLLFLKKEVHQMEIKEMRTAINWTQKEFADAVGVATETFNRWERNTEGRKPHHSFQKAIVRIYEREMKKGA